jgi:integrase
MTVLPLSHLKIFLPTTKKNNYVTTTNIKFDYCFKTHRDFSIDEYVHFYMLLNDDGSLWEYGNRFLLWKIKENEEISHKTLRSLAYAIKDFREFCIREDIDYLSAPRKILRPIWLYRKYLILEIDKGNIKSDKTVKNKIGCVSQFYEWLINIEGVKFKYPLWRVETINVSYVDSMGFKNSKSVDSKDVTQIPGTINQQIDYDYVNDGGRLKPLIPNEQYALIKALGETGNTEMILAFFIALTSGARLETVFTLRHCHFLEKVAEQDHIKIKVGKGTFCDTKRNKRYIIEIPTWLYSQIQCYLNSSRAIKRNSKANKLNDEVHQYIFLTRSGEPYYMSKNDINKRSYQNIPSGNAIAQFRHTTLAKKLKNHGKNFKFTFHDLRATFGMNYIEQNMPLVEQGKLSLSQLVAFLSSKMGHSFLSTTYAYLTYRDYKETIKNVQNEYEIEMMKVLNHGI